MHGHAAGQLNNHQQLASQLKAPGEALPALGVSCAAATCCYPVQVQLAQDCAQQPHKHMQTQHPTWLWQACSMIPHPCTPAPLNPFIPCDGCRSCARGPRPQLHQRQPDYQVWVQAAGGSVLCDWHQLHLPQLYSTLAPLPASHPQQLMLCGPPAGKHKLRSIRAQSAVRRCLVLYLCRDQWQPDDDPAAACKARQWPSKHTAEEQQYACCMHTPRSPT